MFFIILFLIVVISLGASFFMGLFTEFSESREARNRKEGQK